MKTFSKHSKLDDSGCCSISLADTAKTEQTNETDLNIVEGSEASDDELDVEDLDELERDLLNWAEEKRTTTESSKKGTASAPVSPVRTTGKYRKKVTRTRSAGDIPRQQKAFENRLRRALTLNSYEQEQKSEESCMESSEQKNQMRPDDRLKQLLHGVSAKTFQSETWEDYFKVVTEDRVAAHSLEVSNAIRKGKLDKLKRFHAGGVSLDACNNHGESMIHLACRLTKYDIVKFLVEEANVSVRVRDDCGRTPLHEACWTPNPDFKLIQFILNKSPELLFISDNRGFNALRYVPQSCWDDWGSFFEENLTFLRLKINHSEFLNAHCQVDDAQERLQALMRKAAKFSA